jgi:hypothetical protein
MDTDDRGKNILLILVDMLSAIRNPRHHQHHDHEEYSQDAILSILSILSNDTIEVLAQEYKWTKKKADLAHEILERLIQSKAAQLIAIIYRETPRTRRKSSLANVHIEDMKIACIMASIFDFELKAEEYVEDHLAVEQRQLPKR